VARAGIRGHTADASRRELLAGLAAGFALPLAACRDDDPARGPTVAIVGGGMAGVHAAYRLAQAGVSCTLFEATDRVGGRMFTGRGLFSNGHLCELGGEFVDTNHATLWALAEELGIVLDDREAGAAGTLKPEVFWVAGVEVPEATLLTQLEATVDGIAADYDAAESDDAAFAALDAEPLDVWLERRIPSATYPELHAVLRVAYVGEFGLEADEQSALNLVYLVGLDTEERHLLGKATSASTPTREATRSSRPWRTRCRSARS
jgi:monoamine oxidase